MPCLSWFINDECYKVVCTDKKTTACLVAVFITIFALLGFAIYLVAKPIECLDQQPEAERMVIWDSENRMYKHPFRKPAKCKESSILNYPQLVAITEKDTDVHICSGAILPKDWILTAAHCLTLCEDSACSNLNIRVGSSYSNRGGNIYTIEELQIHPNFNSSTLQNNIGLIKLHNFKRKNQTVDYAAISTTTIESQQWAELLGWAPFSKVDIIYRDNVLKTINLTIEPPFVCRYRMKGESTKFIMEENMLCGTYPTVGGGCYTDAGGPLMRDNVVFGVAMFGQFCYSCEYHVSVLTDIHYFRSFIKKFILNQNISKVKH